MVAGSKTTLITESIVKGSGWERQGRERNGSEERMKVQEWREEKSIAVKAAEVLWLLERNSGLKGPF